MSLEAAARRCCVVEHGGRRYLVSAPTLATVVLASGLFPREVAAFAHVAVERPEILTGGPRAWHGVLSDILTDTSDGRAGEILETCCALIGGARGDVLVAVTESSELAVLLGVAVLTLCDVPRCFEGAGWAKLGRTPIEDLEAPRPQGWFDPSDYKAPIGLVQLSRNHGCSPTEVMAWPFEVVLMVNEMTAIMNDPKAAEYLGTSSRVASAAELSGLVQGVPNG